MRAFEGLRMALMKANQTDLSKLLMSNDSDEKSEYEKKLALARSLVIPTRRKRRFHKPTKTATQQQSQEPRSRWLKFESLLPDIQDYIDNIGKEDGELQWHVGGGVFVSLSPGYPTVDIRHFWKPDDAPEPIPTKKGVTLNRNKLAKLRDALEEMHESVPELKDTELCMFSESHQNQFGMLKCPECTPFGYNDQDNMSTESSQADLQDTDPIQSDSYTY
ncbi:hypothetical protein FSP39_014931 [Pinctada imbricata]|uniref:Transcriptional coactivator p15 (PC4) C-terminal domain-containing protein n=1 Tax=Pinctada imbricata TaxID=66713 RepID=A0AA88YKM3_PINIB|nr:hypothetical protein FSP39_014931 [Pinctada imbricata]